MVKPFKLDMPFEEAMRRFVQTDEKEIPERTKLKRRKKAAGRSPPAKHGTREKTDALNRKRQPKASG